MTHHLLYRTTCLATGKWYIGIHSTTNKNDHYLGSGKLLFRSIKKHGRDAHVREILEELPTRDALRAREAEIVTEDLVRNRNCMNTATGGMGGTRGMDERILSGFKARAKRIKIDPKYRAEHAKLASKAGKLGGAKGASSRLQHMASDPIFEAAVRAKIAAGVKANWIKRKTNV